jgi:two-component system, NtrC family, sensor kinase
MNQTHPSSAAPAQHVTHDSAGSVAQALSGFFDDHPVATFAIDRNHLITHWNKACEHLLGWSQGAMVGTGRHGVALYARASRPTLSDLIVDGNTAELGRYQPSSAMPGAYEIEEFFPSLGPSGQWLHFSAAPLRDAQGRIVGAIETMLDVTERRVAENELRQAHDNLEYLVKRRTAELAAANVKLEDDIRQRQQADAELRQRNSELTELNEKLSMAQQQLVQSEKLASIGQLAAGVAHEINNPIGYIFSNFGTLQGYLDQLFAVLADYEAAAKAGRPAVLSCSAEDLDYLREDIPALMRESKEGIARVRHIVQDLKDFSRVDANQDWVWANLHEGIDSTLNIVANEVKYKAEVIKEYGAIPDIECLPSQLNQVIMNLVVNAAHAMGAERGRICIRTRTGPGEDQVTLEVEDNGGGIAPENLSRIFDPFFTTKPIGRGTGLGLSLAYGIVQKHAGKISVASELGKGTTFRIELPVRHCEPEEDGAAA